MGTPAPEPHVSDSPAEPVPVAFIGRTSTLVMQDPAASMRRQVRESKDKLPPGFFISRYYWDIESGGIATGQRGHGTAHEQLPDIGIPRDGGLADLLAEAASPAPGFAAVICEDIERSGRDTYYALQLEKELTLAGIPLFASDEPIDVADATTVLVRRIKQGVAEWFRLQIKEKAGRGLREHSLAGWNIGAPPHGYLAHRVPHPVPMKASQGRTKTRLVLDPERAPAVAAIFTWRTEDKLGGYAITQRLSADPGRYPPPGKAGRWTEASVYAILGNPKYTGYMVFGRQRTLKSGRRVAVPPDQWLWSPEPTHPAIISRATWDAAQAIGAEHSTSRDGTGPNAHPATRRSYILRSRVRCRSCQRRMSGITRTAPRYWDDGPDYGYTYYACTHDPANPRHTAREGHPRSLSVREDHLLEAIRDFFALRVFGPDRAALLAKDLPATAADDQARRDQQAAALNKRLRQIDTAENAHAREIEALAHDATSQAVTALRTRILARFTELEDERTQISAQCFASEFLNHSILKIPSHGPARLTGLEADHHVGSEHELAQDAPSAGAQREVRDVRVGAHRAGHPAGGRGEVGGGPLDRGARLPHREAGRAGRAGRLGAGAAGAKRAGGGAVWRPGRDRAAAGHGHRAGGGAAPARGKSQLGLTAGPVPPRVDACVKAGLLDLVGHACEHG
jgi:site-specific DNA recombinase